jgi:hypothetical protein
MGFIRFLRQSGAGLAFAAVLGLLGCVDPEEGSGGATSGTALYAFDTADAATTRLLIWDNLTALHEADTPPATTRTLTSDQFAKVKNLAWGGLVLDPNGNRLWLVGEAGEVVRVERIRQQSGAIPTTEAVQFNLGNSSDRLNGGKFQQAALDPSTGVLYVMESNDSEARVWILANPLAQAEGTTVTPPQTISVSGDKAGTGLAAGGGALYAFFANGSTVQDGTETRNGARLRKGSANAFQSLLVGPATGLAIHGSLALDTSNNRIYVARHNQASSASGPPISVFTPSQFGLTVNQAPDKGTLGSASLNEIRVLAHPGSKDWLAVLDMSADAPVNRLTLLKGASGATPSVKTHTLGTGVKLKGVALDGNA